MPVTVTFIQTINTTNPEGVAETQDEWQGTRSEDSATITLTFPGGTAQATVQSEIEGWFTANNPLPGPAPAPATEEIITLTAKRVIATGETMLLDKDDKPWFTLKRDASGKATPEVVDSDGGSRRLLTPQQNGSLRLDTGVTEGVVDFETPFPKAEKPSVIASDTDATGKLKTRLRQNVTTEEWEGVDIAIDTAPAAPAEIRYAVFPKEKK